MADYTVTYDTMASHKIVPFNITCYVLIFHHKYMCYLPI